MTRAEIDRLLARYSSGEITPVERDALFTAALDDQSLFEELYQEDTLREALADPKVRHHASLPDLVPAQQPAESHRYVLGKRERPHPQPARPFLKWRWPVLAAVAASLVITVVVFRRPAQEPVQLAQNVRTASEGAPAAAAPALAEPAAPAIPTRSGEESLMALKEDNKYASAGKDKDVVPPAQGIAGRMTGDATPGQIGGIARPEPSAAPKARAGGTAGGVVGGVIGAIEGQRAAPPPPPPAATFAGQGEVVPAQAGREEAKVARSEKPASADLLKAEAATEAERARADAPAPARRQAEESFASSDQRTGAQGSGQAKPAGPDFRASNAVEGAKQAGQAQVELVGAQKSAVSLTGLPVAMRDEAAEPLTLALSASTVANRWRPAQAQESFSPGVPLRLTVRSTVAGRLSFEPAFTAPVAMAAGQTRTFDLPLQQAGEHTIHAILTPAAVTAQAGLRLGPAESAAAEARGGDTGLAATRPGADQSVRAKTAPASSAPKAPAKSAEGAGSSAGAATPAAPLISREIKFRIR